ncbi:MAG: molybdate ABC transporter substrate-binding protein [Rhodocyclales bacterium]|nr:molybdate ABC transporter substrate-binding protein [Rhodocyclales bacterium]
MTIRVFAAGSLRAAFGDLAVAFAALRAVPVELVFGPSGLLRERLLAGEAADVFASANMEHPQALASAGMAGPVRCFARNRLCALAAPRLRVSGATLVERLLDPAVRLGTSTPKADPSGDYAFEFFARAERRHPGAQAALCAKALQIVGGPSSPAPPPGRNLYAKLIGDGAADIFLTYYSNAVQALREAPDLQIVPIPDDLAVGAEFGLTLLGECAATEFADFLLSPAGQALVVRQGFSPAQAAVKSFPVAA